MAESPGVPEHNHSTELAEFERLVAVKREALTREGRPAPEREVFREVFRERYGDVLSSEPAAAPSVAPQGPGRLALPPADMPADTAREAELEEFVVLAFAKGVAAAAGAAKKSSPWLMDELHDRLVDRYYDRLLEARQLKPL